MLDTCPGFLRGYADHSTRCRGIQHQRIGRIPSPPYSCQNVPPPYWWHTLCRATCDTSRATGIHIAHRPLSYLFRNTAAAVEFSSIPSAKALVFKTSSQLRRNHKTGEPTHGHGEIKKRDSYANTLFSCPRYVEATQRVLTRAATTTARDGD